MRRKIEAIFAIATLACAPIVGASEKAAFPVEKVAAFVVDKLDATSLPSVYRPKKEKGKKTLADYGYTAQKLEENEALVGATGGSRRLSIRILQESDSRIYVCVAEPAQDGGDPKTQSVVSLKRKGSNELLKGRESWKEFSSCPVIGGREDSAGSDYGG